MIVAILEALGLRRKHKDGGIVEPPKVERVEYKPPVLLVVPEGAKPKPGYLVKPDGNRWHKGFVTLDAEEALRFADSVSHTVSLIGVFVLPDGQVVRAQHFLPMRRLGVDVVIQEDGTVVEHEECS